jgi:membrane-associated phospholipid phosphatase
VKSLLLVVVLGSGIARADDSGPAYDIKLDVDLPAIGIASLSTSVWFIDLGPAYCAPECKTSTLNPIDRPFAGRYYPNWTTAGTITAGVVLAAPLPILLAFESPKHAAADMVVLTEAVMFASATGVVFEVGARRPRPFLYGFAAPESERNDTNAALSFYSGHTTDSFAATIATWITLDRLHVAPRWRRLVLGLGLAASSFVAVSRVVSGDHFPTDVAVGTGMGMLWGALVPALHKRGVAIAPGIAPDGTVWLNAMVSLR